MLRYKGLILMLLRQQMGLVGRLFVPVLNFLPIHELRHCFHTFPGDSGVTQALFLGRCKLHISFSRYWMCDRACDLFICSHLIRLDVNIKARWILWALHWPALSLAIWCPPHCDPAKLCFHSPWFHTQQFSLHKAGVVISSLYQAADVTRSGDLNKIKVVCQSWLAFIGRKSNKRHTCADLQRRILPVLPVFVRLRLCSQCWQFVPDLNMISDCLLFKHDLSGVQVSRCGSTGRSFHCTSACVKRSGRGASGM